MVSSIRTTLFDLTITMSGLAEVTRISGGIVAGGPFRATGQALSMCRVVGEVELRKSQRASVRSFHSLKVVRSGLSTRYTTKRAALVLQSCFCDGYQ